MATVEDEIQQSILEKKTPSNKELAWIGLHINMSYWFWTADEQLQPSQGFYNWEGDPPGDENKKYRNCAEITRNGLWRTGPCGDKKPFVCFTRKYLDHCMTTRSELLVFTQ